MDNNERMFLETMSKALVSLPFDLKILLEAVADSDLERGVRELAASTVVHVITPKDGNVDAPLRFATLYPITEKSLAGRVKQAQPFVDHLARKRDQDKKKITS